MPPSRPTPELSSRQRAILRNVVEEYVASGQPVGSKTVIQRAGLTASPSTVRSELSELELLGLLTHPHTSAGRVPTEQGYRFYVDTLLGELEPRPARLALGLEGVSSEVETALQATTEMLSHVTQLLALVSAPPFEAATVRHVEILLLQPQVVMVVVITTAGGVTKQMFTFDRPVDEGLASWAREYLNERLVGSRLGGQILRRCFEDPGLSGVEASFLGVLRAAFVDAAGANDQRLYVGGAAGLLAGVRADELGARRQLLEALEKRAALLELVRETLEPRGPFVRVGGEIEHPALHDVALVGASYGFANRALGTVSLLGPVRMDYAMAIRSVRAAALELSRFVEEVYTDN
ncbi:MAG: heat-inducible transcriptional repressor [Gaiellaceae bacterium]|jgi:heat-inducible transcriptional repressor|nr:heat-inducible transcriptional repressor [Gaiellaceae bacterium]